MDKNEREKLTTSIRKTLKKELRKLSIDVDIKFNYLLEEAMEDLLKKYGRPLKKTD